MSARYASYVSHRRSVKFKDTKPGRVAASASIGMSIMKHKVTSAAPSARPRGLSRNSSSIVLVGPRSRDLSGTLSRLRTVACRLRENPVSFSMIPVRTPCEISRRTSSERRLSRSIGSSMTLEAMLLPPSLVLRDDVNHAKPPPAVSDPRLTIPSRFVAVGLVHAEKEKEGVEAAGHPTTHLDRRARG